MKRVSLEALEAAAWAERKMLEYDHDANIAVLVVKGQTFYADLPMPDDEDVYDHRALMDVLATWAGADVEGSK